MKVVYELNFTTTLKRQKKMFTLELPPRGGRYGLSCIFPDEEHLNTGNKWDLLGQRELKWNDLARLLFTCYIDNQNKFDVYFSALTNGFRLKLRLNPDCLGLRATCES